MFNARYLRSTGLVIVNHAASQGGPGLCECGWAFFIKGVDPFNPVRAFYAAFVECDLLFIPAHQVIAQGGIKGLFHLSDRQGRKGQDFIGALVDTVKGPGFHRRTGVQTPAGGPVELVH